MDTPVEPTAAQETAAFNSAMNARVLCHKLETACATPDACTWSRCG